MDSPTPTPKSKPATPRATKVVAGALFGGLGAAVLGQRYSPWVLASQLNTVVTVVIGALLAGVIVWVATRAPDAP